MTIAKRNAIKWPNELGNTGESDALIKAWAKDAVRTAECGYIEYPHAHQTTIWDMSKENGALMPSDASYTPLLEPNH